MSSYQIGFIGAGNMAGAIMGGIVRGQLLASEEIGVFDIDETKRRECGETGYKVFDSIPALVSACKYILLAVKPQSFSQVLPEVKSAITTHKVLISIAAGITSQAIQQGIGFPCKLVLVMPNTPLMLGQGASALSRIDPCSSEEFEFVRKVFATSGVAAEIRQEQMSEIIPVNGSSPAFIYQFAKVIVDRAVEQGIDADVANRLFCQTLIGAAHMMMESGKSHQELIDMVCSPGGTTLAAMEAMKEQGFDQAVQAAYDACVRRAKELAKG